MKALQRFSDAGPSCVRGGVYVFVYVCLRVFSGTPTVVGAFAGTLPAPLDGDAEPADWLRYGGGDLLVVLGQVAVAEAAWVLPALRVHPRLLRVMSPVVLPSPPNRVRVHVRDPHHPRRLRARLVQLRHHAAQQPDHVRAVADVVP